MAAKKEHRGRQKRPGRAKRHAAGARPCGSQTWRSRSRPGASSPSRWSRTSGPTNSGKTHAALEFLAESGRGVFAAPLRMLAQEAHRRLSAQLGPERVGLVTGEERVNEDAPIVCCTAEMAPMRGEVLVVDEVQWADDPERGAAWTRLLLAAEYRHILLLGAVEALPLVRNAFPDVDVRFFERKAPLDWTGSVAFGSLKPGTVVVAFSRRAVLALAGELARRHPGRVVRPLRRHAARLSACRDRPLPQRRRRRLRRHRRARPRRQPPLRDAAFRRDDEVRRPGATRAPLLGDRPDRRPSRPLRPRRARPCRRADGDRLGAGRSRSRRVGARPARPAPRRSFRLPRRRHRPDRGRGSRTCRSSRRCSSPPLCAPGTTRPCASGRPRAGSPSSRSARCSGRLDTVQRRLREQRPEALARADLEARERSGRRGQRGAARERSLSRSRATAGNSPCWAGCWTRTGCATPRSRTRSTLPARPASSAGSRCSTRASAVSRSNGRRRWSRRPSDRVTARLAAEVRSPSVGRCRSCGQPVRRGSRSATAAFRRVAASRASCARKRRATRIVATITTAATVFGMISAKFSAAIP